MNTPRTVLAGLLTLLAAGCGSEPGGQVVATLDGTEITRREVLVEVREAQLAGPDAERTALERLIDRKLLVAGAREMLVDRSPEFQIGIWRDREMALAALMEDRLAAQQPAPDAASIAQMIAAEPHRYLARKQAVVDRVEVDALPADAALPETLGSNEALAAWLRARSIGFTRSLALLDTAQLAADEAARVTATAAGPRIAREGTHLRSDQTVLVREVAWPRRAVEEQARAEIHRQRGAAALQAWLASRRQTGKILIDEVTSAAE